MVSMISKIFGTYMFLLLAVGITPKRAADACGAAMRTVRAKRIVTIRNVFFHVSSDMTSFLCMFYAIAHTRCGSIGCALPCDSRK